MNSIMFSRTARKLQFRAPLLAAALSVSALAPAQGLYEWESYEKRMESSESVAALGSDVFGDNVNLQNGALSFSVTDVDIPGNNGLPVRFARSYQVQNSRESVNNHMLADWTVQLPRIHGQFAAEWVSESDSTQRCSNFVLPRITPPTGAPSGTFIHRQFWRGLNVDIPGVASGEMLLTESTTTRPTDRENYRWTTSDGLVHFYCETSTNLAFPGEVFVAVTSDGTRYYFDVPARRDVPDVRVPRNDQGGANVGDYVLPVVENSLYASKVEDRFGNKVFYSYSNSPTSPVHLTGISANDGRQLSIGYHRQNGFISTVTAGSRTWTYIYQTNGSSTLDRVQLPDGRNWLIAFAALSRAPIEYSVNSDRNCGLAATPDNVAALFPAGTITHPSGVSATFNLRLEVHGQSNVTLSCTEFPVNSPWEGIPEFAHSYYAWTLVRKTVSGPGVSAQVWDYDYDANISTVIRGSPDPQNSVPICLNSNIPAGAPLCGSPTCTSGWCGASMTTVKSPDNSIQTYYIGNSWQYNEGKLLKVERKSVHPLITCGPDECPVLELETSEFDLRRSAGAYRYGRSTQVNNDGFEAEYLRPQLNRVLTRDGATFTWQVNAMDSFARPTSVARSSSVSPAGAKNETYTFADNLKTWVVGQLQSTHVNGTETAFAEYNAADQLQRVRIHGLWKQTLTYHPDGAVHTVTDGKNQVTTLTQWYRGVPKHIRYHDGSVVEAPVVDNNGWIWSTKNERGHVTGYGYDSMGRITSITPPSDPTNTWSSTSITFTPITTPVMGLSSGHWKQSLTRGAYRQDTYFDALWRPVLVHESGSGLNRYSVKGWDGMNRESFSAYPRSALTNVSAATTGVRRNFDGLGRQWGESADSELGALTTQIAYLTGFRKRITNPRGKATTLSFLAWDQPVEELPVLVEAPAGQTTTITRDIHGKPTRIHRTTLIEGVSTTVERRYVYDSAQRLCKRIEPETGAHLFGYDAADNLEWSVHGGASTGNQCDAMPTLRIQRSHDARNRLSGINYPDATADIGYTYYPDGTLWTASRYGSTWTYDYNSLGLIKSESLAYAGNTRTFGYAYDTLGQLSSIQYPDNEVVNYAPNALGQPAQVGAYANGLSWHADGSLAAASFANGVMHTRALNTRQLPERLRYSMGSQPLVELQYAFDANANVQLITDHAQSGRDSQSFGYDDLDRLTSASAPATGNYYSAGFEYDAFDNIRRSTLGKPGTGEFRDLRYKYQDGTNRLTAIALPDGLEALRYGYDTRGNATSAGPVLTTFDQADTVTSVVGAAASPSESYKYDAHGHRIEIVADGVTRYPVYTKDGLLRMEYQGGQADSYYYLGTSLIAKSGAAGGTPPADLIFASSAEPLGSGEAFKHVRELPGMKSGSTVTWYLSDHLGSNVATTDAAGQVVERSQFAPFGERWGKIGERGPGYTGHFEDKTSMTYMKARYYSGIVGRFISADPVGVDTTSGENFNRYWYANNNPINNVDPDGQAAIALAPWAVRAAWFVGRRVIAEGIRNIPVRQSSAARWAEGARSRQNLENSIKIWTASDLAAPAIQNAGSSAVPEIPDDLVGDQNDPRAGVNKGGKRHTSGPLKPEHGGTGDFDADLDVLTGGVRPWAPGDSAPPGSLVGENGIFGRPSNSSGGKSIDIPAKGKKPHETLHY